jgi:hypothetical protein
MFAASALWLAVGATTGPAQGVAAAPVEGAAAMRLLYVRERGAEACPDEATLRSAVVGRLGYDPFVESAGAALFARIGRSETGLRGSIERVDEVGFSRGKRELVTEGEGCEEMARAVALSMSIAIDPERAALAADASGAPPPAAAAPVESTPAAPEPAREPSSPLQQKGPLLAHELSNADKASDATDPKPQRLSFSNSLSGLAMLGAGPAPAFGGLLAVQIGPGSWLLGAGGRLVRTPPADVERGARLQTTLAAGELSICVRKRVIDACMLGLAGATWVRGGGVDTPRTDSGAFVALGMRLGSYLPLSRAVALLAHVEGFGVISPIRAEVDRQQVWEAPWEVRVTPAVNSMFAETRRSSFPVCTCSLA